MLTQADFEARLIANIDDFEILERYNAQDPIVLKFLRSLVHICIIWSRI
jgi:hypothetical protein